jgi:hypothetical protein
MGGQLLDYESYRALLTEALGAQGFSFKRKSGKDHSFTRELSPDHDAVIRVGINRMSGEVLGLQNVYLGIVSRPVSKLALAAMNTARGTAPKLTQVFPGVRLDDSLIRGSVARDLATWTRQELFSHGPEPLFPSGVPGYLQAVAQMLVAEHPTLAAALTSKRFFGLGFDLDVAAYAYLRDRDGFEKTIERWEAWIEERATANAMKSPGRHVLIAASDLNRNQYVAALRASFI